MYNQVMNPDLGGTFLIKHLSDESFLKLKARYLPDGEECDFNNDDVSKGYDGLSWSFRDEEGKLFSVYTRWGVPRLGGHSDLTDVEVNDFETWLTNL